jgi:hypothetical protein
MSETAPTRAAFDRTAATILGSMITLIAALTVVLVEISVESKAEHLPVAAWAPERSATPRP